MNKKILILGFSFILASLLFSGCQDLFNGGSSGVLYESHPTKISFELAYGYMLNCSGTGDIEIQYDCDTPEVLKGSAQIRKILNGDYSVETVATYNKIYRWNFTTSSCEDYELGLETKVISESLLVNDLNGDNALTLSQIKNNHPELVNQYCNIQSNETTIFIDPENPKIKGQALQLKVDSGTDNAFLIAKEIFKWLKKETTYVIHNFKNEVQPASETFEKGTGDCDDLSFLYISLCRSLDIPARFIRGFLIEENQAIPHAWSEIYVGGNIGNNGWIPVECAGTAYGKNKITTEINQNFGVETADHLRLFKDDGSNESLIISLSGIVYSADTSLIVESPFFFARVSKYQILQSNELFVNNNGNRLYQ